MPSKRLCQKQPRRKEISVGWAPFDSSPIQQQRLAPSLREFSPQIPEPSPPIQNPFTTPEQPHDVPPPIDPVIQDILLTYRSRIPDIDGLIDWIRKNLRSVGETENIQAVIAEGDQIEPQVPFDRDTSTETLAGADKGIKVDDYMILTQIESREDAKKELWDCDWNIHAAIAKYHPVIISKQNDLDVQEFPHSPLSEDSENVHPTPSSKAVLIDLTGGHQLEYPMTDHSLPTRISGPPSPAARRAMQARIQTGLDQNGVRLPSNSSSSERKKRYGEGRE